MSNIPKILEDMYLKNLKFFKKQNPKIHHVISNTTPDHSNIIISDEGKIDLKYNGRTIYGGDAIQFVQDEVAEFNEIYKDKIRVNSVHAPSPGVYSAPRFFHKHLNETITKLFDAAEAVHTNVIHTTDKHDFAIIMGIGLGLHITELLEHTNIQNLLILETDHELLTLSCFFTDWEYIYEKQNTKGKKSITLLLLDSYDLNIEQGSLWNELIKRAPHFPYNTVFYNHGRHDKYGKIIRKVSEDIKMFLSLWGFYDDESNQLNHVLHNINNDVKLIPKKSDFNWSKPVIICGSAPSLDNRINQLKSIRNDCILISAGSSIDALVKYGLTPDFHIELESDYLVYTMLKNVGEDITKNITLICAIQCSPLLRDLFKDSYLFVKDSLSIGGAFEEHIDKLREPTPTCVNAAISFAFHYSAKSIYLFGTDFGFYDKNKHHSIKSVYHDEHENHEKEIKNVQDLTNKMMSENFEQPGYDGPCLTTSTYYATKRRIDMLIQFCLRQYQFNLYNCSDGLIIDHAIHVKSDTVISVTKNDDTRVTEISKFKSLSRSTNKDMQEKIKQALYPAITNLCLIFHNHVKNMENNIEDLSATCWALSNYVNTTFQEKNGNIMYFIRGTIWHYTLAGYSIAYACEPKDQEKIISLWKERFLDLLESLPNDLLKNLKKERTSYDLDEQLTKTIREE